MLLLLLAATPAADVSAVVFADGRDDRTLLRRKLINRELPEQLASDEASFRIGQNIAPLSAAGDVLLGTQLALDGRPPSSFHGFFLLDGYLALRLLEEVDVNLNLLALAMTASGGTRRTNDLFPGLAAHLRLPLLELDGDRIRLDFVGTDLDLVTIGQGLLIEETPLEGMMGGLRWRGFELFGMFGGRVFLDDDDLVVFSASAFERRVAVSYARWFGATIASDPFRLAPGGGAEIALFDAHYLAGHARIEPLEGLTLAAEAALRLNGKTSAPALLLRTDYRLEEQWLTLHVGYQFRWYRTGFSPVNGLFTATTLPNTPLREDAYVTNSFEYLGISPFYDQWSHTGMLELLLHLKPIEIFLEGELWARWLSDNTKEPARALDFEGFGRAPGRSLDFFYRAGLRFYPFSELPHRAVIFLSNKSVISLERPIEPTSIRFAERPILFFEAEVLL